MRANDEVLPSAARVVTQRQVPQPEDRMDKDDGAHPGHWGDVARLFPSFGLQQLFQALTGFLIVRLLLPEQYGVWSLFALVLAFAMQLHLGAINLMHQEVPFLVGRQEHERAQQVVDTAFSSSLTNCLIAAVLVVTVGAVWRPHVVTFAQVVLLAALIVFQELFTFVNFWLRAWQRFGPLGAFLTFYACANLAVVAGLAWWKQLTGVLLGYVLTNALAVVVFVAREKIPLHFAPTRHWSWAKLKRALELLLWTMMFMFLATLDRVYIGHRLGMLNLGLFGVSVLLSNLLYSSADVVLQVLFPRANAVMGDSGDPSAVGGLLLGSAETLSYMLSAALGLGFLLLPVVVPFLLPRYEEGIPAARVICLGLAGLVLAQLISVAYVALGQVRRCLLLQAAVLIVKAASLLALRNPGLTAVAIVSSAANVLYLIVIVAGNPIPGWRPFEAICRLLVPWVLVGAVLGFAAIVPPVLSPPVLRAAAPSLLFVLVAGPLLWKVHAWTRRRAHG